MARKKKSSNDVPVQTLTARAKVVNLSDQDALLLGLLGFFAKQKALNWNVANHHRRRTWKETGNIPGFAEQCRELKTNRWYKLLPSQSSQEILGELDDSYRSWFAHRKNGNGQAKPPGFRKKDSLSAITFKQKALKMLPDDRVQLRLPRICSRREITLEYRLPPKDVLGEVKQVKLVLNGQTGDWYLHIIHNVAIEYRKQGNIMALDLGIVNIAAGILTTGQTFLVPGGGLLALDRYFHKEIAKCNSSK